MHLLPGTPLPKVSPEFADAGHVNKEKTRRSASTGIVLFANSTPLKWYSERQENSIEAYTYWAELVGQRIMMYAANDDGYNCKLAKPSILMKQQS